MFLKPISLGHLIVSFLLGLLTFSSIQAVDDESEDTIIVYDDDNKENITPGSFASYYQERFGSKAFSQVESSQMTEENWREQFFSFLIGNEQFEKEVMAISNLFKNRVILGKMPKTWASQFKTVGQYAVALHLAEADSN